jgi:biotin transport system substrate-specific component
MQNAHTLAAPLHSTLLRKLALVIGGSLLVAICARLSVPLPFTPVPLTLANFAVLLVGLTLGSRMGAASLLAYLAAGAAGLPVFSPAGPGGIAQLLGPTGGYLLAYPVAAFVAGWIAEHGRRRFGKFFLAAAAGNLLLFTSGVAWLTVLTNAPLAQAAAFGLYPFVFAEIIKLMAAAATASRAPNFAARN